MKLIIENGTNRVLYAGKANITNKAVIGNGWIDTTNNSSTVYSANVPELPEFYEDGLFCYSGGVFTFFSESGTLGILNDLIEKKCARVDQLRENKFYKNVTATFPDGDRIIPLNDQMDNDRFLSTANLAQIMVVSGQGDQTVSYITKNGAIQQPTASQMLSIVKDIMVTRQAIAEKAQEHKNSLRSKTTIADVKNYDITTGW